MQQDNLQTPAPDDQENIDPNMGENSFNESSDAANKFKIQGLEEVTEMTNESDKTSQMSYTSIEVEDLDDDLSGASSMSSSINGSACEETLVRIKVAEDIKEVTGLIGSKFKKALIPFEFEYEDYENCKLNIEIKKMIAYMKVTLPIVYIKTQNKYFIGIKSVQLELKGAFIHVRENDHDEKTVRFNEYISKNTKLFQKHLCFYMLRSKWEIEKIIQALIDNKPIANITEMDHQVFNSYMNPLYSKKFEY